MKEKILKSIFIVIFISILAYLIFGVGILDKSNLVKIFEAIEGIKNFEVYFTIIITILMVFFIPISWFSALGALFFGLKGFIYILIGGTIASIISFYMAKIFKKDIKMFVEKIYNRKERNIDLDKISNQIEDYGVIYIFLMRNIPFMTFSIGNYVSGWSSVSLGDYILGTILGIAPSQFITTYFFTKAINVRKNPLQLLLAAIIKFAYFLLIIFSYKKFKSKIQNE